MSQLWGLITTRTYNIHAYIHTYMHTYMHKKRARLSRQTWLIIEHSGTYVVRIAPDPLCSSGTSEIISELRWHADVPNARN